LPLVTGTVLAIAALCLVLAPLVSDPKPSDRTADDRRQNARREGDEESGSAVAALREIEFDRATGKLSDSDYADLRQRYTRAALHELRTSPNAEAGATTATDNGVTLLSLDDAVEAAIARAKETQRRCGVCGPRPEIDAIYCSSCGRYLPGACGKCGNSIDLVGSRFCSNCGEHLAAA